MNHGMKRNTLAALFNNKIEAWLETIKDLNVRAAASRDVILSGGAIASGLMGDKINDYDLYFRTQDTALAVAKYYCDVFTTSQGQKENPNGTSRNPTASIEQIENCRGTIEDRVVIRIKSAGKTVENDNKEYKYFEGSSACEVEQYFESTHSVENPIETVEELQTSLSQSAKLGKFRPVFLTDNAISLSEKVQLVIRFYGNPDELHANYDFVHAMCYYDYSKREMNVPPVAMESMMSKALVYGGSLYPIASLLRIRKFLARGWRINAGQMLKIVYQASQLDLNDPKVLREQLIGVDMAYMHQLLGLLNNKEAGQKIDSTYFAKLVDEVFEK
jgi:hypothetical protein